MRNASEFPTLWRAGIMVVAGASLLMGAPAMRTHAETDPLSNVLWSFYSSAAVHEYLYSLSCVDSDASEGSYFWRTAGTVTVDGKVAVLDDGELASDNCVLNPETGIRELVEYSCQHGGAFGPNVDRYQSSCASFQYGTYCQAGTCVPVPPPPKPATAEYEDCSFGSCFCPQGFYNNDDPNGPPCVNRAQIAVFNGASGSWQQVDRDQISGEWLYSADDVEQSLQQAHEAFRAPADGPYAPVLEGALAVPDTAPCVRDVVRTFRGLFDGCYQRVGMGESPLQYEECVNQDATYTAALARCVQQRLAGGAPPSPAAPEMAQPPVAPLGVEQKEEKPCIQVTEETAQYDGKLVYPRCQNSLIQLRAVCQTPTGPPSDVAVDCRSIEYAPGKLYKGCQRGRCDKERIRSFEELLEAMHHDDPYPVPSKRQLMEFILDLHPQEWGILWERHDELRPLYWQGLLMATEQLFDERDALHEFGRVHGADDLHAQREAMNRLLRERGQPGMSRYRERLYDQAIAFVEEDEERARRQLALEESLRKAAARSERLAYLEQQRADWAGWNEKSELEKWMASALYVTPGLRLLHPRHRRTFMDPNAYLFERIDSAMGPMGGFVPYVGWPSTAIATTNKVKAKLVDHSSKVSGLDIGLGVFDSALPGLSSVPLGPLTKPTREAIAEVGGIGVSAVDFAIEEVERSQEREQLLQEHLRREEWERAHQDEEP